MIDHRVLSGVDGVRASWRGQITIDDWSRIGAGGDVTWRREDRAVAGGHVSALDNRPWVGARGDNHGLVDGVRTVALVGNIDKAGVCSVGHVM